MKTIALSFALLTMVIGLSKAQNVEIPDTAFLYALISDGVDTNGDSLISITEAEAATKINVSGEGYRETTGKITCTAAGNIISLKGIEAFTNIDTLICHCNLIDSLDLSSNTSLRYLDCGGNMLHSLDVSGLTALENLYCSNNQFTTLNLYANTTLNYLECSYNQIDTLDISHNTALLELWCSDNQLSTLDVSINTALTHLVCSNNLLSSLDLTDNTDLLELYCKDNLFTSLDVSNNPKIQLFMCGGNLLSNLDISLNPDLVKLYCNDNLLTSLTVLNNPNLFTLNCNGNLLNTLDISQDSSISELYLRNMPTLNEVCVWKMPFPPDPVYVDTTASPNVYFTTECTTGLNEYKNEDLNIYPNPTNNLLNIEISTPGQLLIEITSLNGQLLYTGRMEGPTHQIDLSSFEKGLYFITVRSRNYARTEKLIKQ